MLGPSLGTSAATLWSAAAARAHRRTSTCWPGTCPATATTGRSPRSRSRWPSWPPACSPWSTRSGHATTGVVRLRRRLGRRLRRPPAAARRPRPGRLRRAALHRRQDRRRAVWADRIAPGAARPGTPVLVGGAVERWFAPGFADRDPDTVSSLLHALQDTDDLGYVRVCEALAGFDVRDRLGEIGAPVLAVAGADDPVTTTEHLPGDRHRRTPRRPGRAAPTPRTSPRPSGPTRSPR